MARSCALETYGPNHRAEVGGGACVVVRILGNGCGADATGDIGGAGRGPGARVVVLVFVLVVEVMVA